MFDINKCFIICIKLLELHNEEKDKEKIYNKEDHGDIIKEILKEFKTLSEQEKDVSLKVFEGCVLCGSFLDFCVQQYQHFHISAMPSDFNLYKVICYISALGSAEIPLDTLHNILLCLSNHIPFCRFLRFFFEEKSIERWIDFLDEYVEDSHDVLSNKWSLMSPQINLMCSTVEDEMMEKNKKKNINLAKRLLEVSFQTKFLETNEWHLLLANKNDPYRLIRFFNTLNTYNSDLPAFSSSQLSHFNIESYEEEENEENRTNSEEHENNSEIKTKLQMKSGKKSKRSNMPTSSATNALNNKNNNNYKHNNKNNNNNNNSNNMLMPMIRMNTASILKEGHLFKMKQLSIINRINELESGGMAGEMYNELKKEWDEEKKEREKENTQLLKLNCIMTREQALLAKKVKEEEKKQKVCEMKQEAEQLMNQLLLQRLNEAEDNRKRIERVMSMKEDSKGAAKRIQMMKAENVREMQNEMKMLWDQVLFEAEEEMRQKMRLIEEIREMQSNLREIKMQKMKEKALNENNFGLLVEMTSNQLKEKLQSMKEEKDREMEEKKREIQREKNVKKRMIDDTLNLIVHHRSLLANEACNRSDREKKKERETDKKSERVIEMERRIAMLRQQRMK